ncbi:MAG TPA: hypothetical protein VM243_06775 [Phycisphaerae bacterium]|nr:hypothetical protein [Phycisphaerae bacterium]
MALLIAVKVFAASAILWSVIALAVQVWQAWGGGRRDYSERAGSPARGVVYNFTVAMTPAHKETIRRHPFAFAIGLVMHVGVVLVLVSVVLLLAWPAAGGVVLRVGRPVVVLSLLAGAFLLVRRAVAGDLRAMNAPDDYLAVAVTCVLLLLASIPAMSSENPVVLLIYSGLLALYLPLGKLRHVVFFFVARADYGRRLGYRGVYPPADTGRG